MQEQQKIANDKGLLIASELKHEGDSFVCIRRSPQVQTTDELYDPIKEHFKEKCCLEMENRTVKERGWLLGKVNISSYYLFEKCPGEDVEHSCGKMKLFKSGQRIFGIDRDGIRGSVHQFQVSMP